MLVLSFPDEASRGERLARALGCEFVSVEYKVFPDGEDYVRVPVDVKGRDVVVLSTLYPDQDRKIFRTLLLLDALRDLGAGRIVLACPYFAYARQDRRFRDGEAVSLKSLIKLFECAGADVIVTVDVHKPEAFRGERARCVNVEPFGLYAEKIRQVVGGERIVVLSPDFGSLWRAQRVAEKLGVEFDYFEKYRDRITGEITMKPRQVDVKDKVVVIVDDIIATGGTLREATRIVKSMGAKKVVAVATHCQLLGGADAKLREAGIETIMCSDTLETPYSNISVIELIADEIRKILS